MNARAVSRVVGLCLLAGLLITGVVPAVADSDIAAGESNDTDNRPYAEAGLDQRVPLGNTVYLDAFGSRAAEGELVAYEWEIQRPNGTVIEPDCPTCEATEFRAMQRGEYVVTVTVRDDSGREATDIMYVTVTEHDPPRTFLNGPDTVPVGQEVSIGLGAQTGTGELMSVTWHLDGEQERAVFLDGDWASDVLRFTPERVGDVRVTATVRDTNGSSATARHNLAVRKPANFEVEITDTESVQQRGSTALEVTAEIENTGGLADSQSIELCADSCTDGALTTMASDLRIEPGESVSVSGIWPEVGTESLPVDAVVASEDDVDRVTIDGVETGRSGDDGNKPAPYFDAKISIDNELEIGESVDLSVDEIIVWPDGGDGVRGDPDTFTVSRSEFVNLNTHEFGVPYNPTGFDTLYEVGEKPGYSPLTVYATGTVYAEEAGTEHVCIHYEDTYGDPEGMSWGSCTEIKVIDNNDRGTPN